MTLTRRTLAAALALAALAPARQLRAGLAGQAPIRIVVPFAAGGTSDILARTLGEKLQAALKQTVVVENKAGAGGVIGADAVAKSPPDGYTLLLGTIASHAINPALQPKMPYDAAKDFAPVILLGSISNVLLVGADAALQEREGPDRRRQGQAGQHRLRLGRPGQLAAHVGRDVQAARRRRRSTHVPYKGSAPGDAGRDRRPDPDELRDRARWRCRTSRRGKVRALAVTSAKRSQVLPDVPTLQEAGVPGFDVASWQAIYAPAGTPRGHRAAR